MCTSKEPTTNKQQDSLSIAIQCIKDKRKITISTDSDLYRTAWKNCSVFNMHDYYTLVTDVKQLDAEYSKSISWLKDGSDVEIVFESDLGDKSKRSRKRKAKKDESQTCEDESATPNQSNLQTQLVDKLRPKLKNFFNSNVIPLQAAIAPHSGVNTEVEDLIKILSLFWNIEELSPYAPLLTMNAIMTGLPPKVRSFLIYFENYIESETNNFKTSSNFKTSNDSKDKGIEISIIEGDKANFINALKKLVEFWSAPQRVTRYSTYRGEASHASDKHVERNFWVMIFFLKMQYELVKNGHSSSKPSTPPKLNEIYSSFLLSWPYSPQLFIDVKDTDDLTISDKKWEEILQNFFESIPILQSESQMYDALEEVSAVYNPNANRYYTNYLAFSDRYILTLPDSEKKGNGNCLVPFSPYFAAYYYLDDSWLHRMTHQEDGEKYKKALFILLTSYARIPSYEMPFAHETRDARGNKIYENENHGVICLPSGEIGSPPPVSREEYRKLLSFLNSTEGKCIQERLDHYLDYDYYSLLYGASSLGVPRLRIWNEIYRSVLKGIGHET